MTAPAAGVVRRPELMPAIGADARPGEIAIQLPPSTDAGVYFIGRIRTPWRTRSECPRQGNAQDGPVCRLELDEFWTEALAGIERHANLQVLYWLHQARRDLVRQSPRSDVQAIGTFALRSPIRPNPIGSGVVAFVGREGATLLVRGLDCIDGTPLIDIKPEFGAVQD